MKKIVNVIFVIFLFMFYISTLKQNAYAKNIDVYKNKNGVEVSSKEYDFINDFYGTGYFDSMSIEDYKWIKDLNIDDSDVEIKEGIKFNVNPNGTFYTQQSRILKIVKSCSENCVIIIKCDWLFNPNIRSYDVIGVRLFGTKLLNQDIITKVKSGDEVKYYNNVKIMTNGYGSSIKLPDSKSSIVIEQKTTVSKSGSVYATYQHANKNISLTDSQSFVIDSTGYGKVLSFYGNAVNVYDGAGGVNINL